MADLIPKIIHYCWFGNQEKPRSVINCISSWQKYCPDYEIREWNEKNSDLSANAYIREAYQARKWAFVSDYVRLAALIEQGGVYLDTDVELLKSLDPLLENEAFCGFETPDRVATAVLGSKKKHPLFLKFLKSYENSHFINPDGSYNRTTNVVRLSRLLADQGFSLNGEEQCLEKLHLYPVDYFCPRDFETGKINLSPDSYAIHHFDNTWWSEEEKYQYLLKMKFLKFMPRKLAGYLSKGFAAIRFRGFSGLREIVKKLIKTLK